MAEDKQDPKRDPTWLKRLLRQLQQLVYNNYLAVLNMSEVQKVIKRGNDGFFFSHNDTANKSVNKILQGMAKQMDYLLLNGIERSWKQGEEDFVDKQKAILPTEAGDEQEALDRIRTAATQASREHTAKTFYHEKRNGFNISERVWNLAGNAKKEMEIILQNGIKEGKSAEEIQKSLKTYLNEPDSLFRRVRNKETGQLELSKAAQQYKPGQGVYRSAYANAMRLARTEINAAFRQAEWEAYQQDPLITGFRIVLSNNHTTLKDGTPVPLKDICDKLQGEYPKSFRWTGWHPQCRCRMEPIMNRSNFKDYLKAVDNEKDQDFIPTNAVQRPPKAFDEWVNENQERAKGWVNMPYFIRDNPQFVKTRFDVNTYTDEEKKFTRQRSTKEAMQRVRNELSKLYPDIKNTELAAIHHYTITGGFRQLNKQMEKDSLTPLNKAKLTLIEQGLSKLPAYEGAVYRGMIIKRKDFEKAFAGDAGAVVCHNRFVSTSRDFEVSRQFASHSVMKKSEVRVFMEITSKTGRDISRISEKNGIFDPENQQEVLFTANTRFKIVSKRVYQDGDIYLKIEEI